MAKEDIFEQAEKVGNAYSRKQGESSALVTFKKWLEDEKNVPPKLLETLRRLGGVAATADYGKDYKFPKEKALAFMLKGSSFCKPNLIAWAQTNLHLKPPIDEIPAKLAMILESIRRASQASPTPSPQAQAAEKKSTKNEQIGETMLAKMHDMQKKGPVGLEEFLKWVQQNLEPSLLQALNELAQLADSIGIQMPDNPPVVATLKKFTEQATQKLGKDPYRWLEEQMGFKEIYKKMFPIFRQILI